jgi:hypothetical protein
MPTRAAPLLTALTACYKQVSGARRRTVTKSLAGRDGGGARQPQAVRVGRAAAARWRGPGRPPVAVGSILRRAIADRDDLPLESYAMIWQAANGREWSGVVLRYGWKGVANQCDVS